MWIDAFSRSPPPWHFGNGHTPYTYTEGKAKEILKKHPYSCHRVYNNNTRPISQAEPNNRTRSEKNTRKKDQDRPAAIAETDVHSFHMATWSTESANGLIIWRELRTIARRWGWGNGIKNTWGVIQRELGRTTRHPMDSKWRGEQQEGKAHSSRTKIKMRETTSANASGDANAPWISHALSNGQTNPAQLDRR